MSRLARLAAATTFAAASFCGAQDIPLLSGGVGFFTDSNGGSTSYQPHIEPLIAAPIGKSLLVEGRGILPRGVFAQRRGPVRL